MFVRAKTVKPEFLTMKNTVIKTLYMSLVGLATIGVTACGGGGGGGSTTPGVSSVNPANGATNVSKTTVVTATFRDGMDETDLAANIQAEFTLVDNSLTSISGVTAYDETLNVASFNPDVNLGVLKGYTASLGAGGTITHSGGTVMPEYTWSFTTAEGSWGTSENIEIDPSSDFSEPTVTVAGNGDAMAIWKSISGSTWIVHYNKYSSSTAIWGNMQTLTSSTNNAITDLKIAMDNSGNAIAIWNLDVPGGNKDLMASFFNGTSWDGTPTQIDLDVGVNNLSAPQIAFDGSSNAIAIWLENGSVYANRYNGSWGTALDIDAGVGNVTSPQLAVFDNGNAIAVWAEDDGAAGPYDIYVSHYDATLDSWGSATPLGNTVTGSLPQVAVSDSGDAMVVWLQGTDPFDAYVAVYDGSVWGSPTNLSDTEDAHISTIPRVGIDSSGNGVAIWRAAPTAGVDRLRYRMYTSGSGWGTAGNIDNGVSDSSEPKLVMDDEGHVIVVWLQDNNDTDMVASTWANRYRADTGNWGTPVLLETVDYADAPTNAVAAPVTSTNLGMNKYNGNAFAIWLQNHDQTFNSVWVNHFE